MKYLFCIAAVVLLAALFGIAEVSATDYYRTMGLGREATEDEIKKTFKQLTRKYHPDRQRGKSDEEKASAKKYFMEIADAYAVLSDSKKREDYDKSGGRPLVTAGDDRNYLKSNLFKDDFDGDEVGEEELQKALAGKLRSSLFVFFWSSNFPECVDAGLAWKELATRLKGSTVRVVSYQCDNQPQMCRQLRIGNPPVAFMFASRTRNKWDRYPGKFESQLLTEFSVKYLRVGNRLTVPTSEVALTNTCPNPMQSLPAKWVAAPFLWETAKKCYVGATRAEFVAFQYSKCYDCSIELGIALETLYPVMPSLLSRTINCKQAENKEFCAKHAPQRKNKAWTIARFVRKCWYATKKPYSFSNEYCEEPTVSSYEGKYNSAEYVNFMLAGHKSHILNLHTMNRVKNSNDSYAILYSNGEASPLIRQHWEILARRVNTIKALTNNKGYRVYIAQMDCSKPYSNCDAVKGRELPVVGLFSFGQKAKKVDPTVYTRIGSGAAMLTNIRRDMEPLHLYQLTPQSYNSKVNGALNKGKKWFIMYNAGQWCPPCNQMRNVWPKVARIVQNDKAAAKKLNIGIVDCEKYKKLCGQLGIDNYPTMSFISKGRPKMDFNGGRDAESAATWAIEAIDNRLQSFGGYELQQNLHQGKNLLVTFTAGSWCPPCTQLKPTIKKVANVLTEIPVTSVDCDEQQQLCMQFGIDGYPTVVMFSGGRQHPFEDGQKNVDSIVKFARKFL